MKGGDPIIKGAFYGCKNFSSKQSNKLHEANPFIILNISLENNAEVKWQIFFFFSFLFHTLRFFRKIGQSFLCFADFPKFTKPAKTFKNTSNFQIFNFFVRTPRPQLNQHNIYTYTYIHFNHQNILNFFNSMHFFFYQKIGLESDLSRPPTYLVH